MLTINFITGLLTEHKGNVCITFIYLYTRGEFIFMSSYEITLQQVYINFSTCNNEMVIKEK